MTNARHWHFEVNISKQQVTTLKSTHAVDYSLVALVVVESDDTYVGS
jgi:hypothetical protein